MCGEPIVRMQVEKLWLNMKWELMDKKLRQQHYDRFYGDAEARKFYNSSQWKKVEES